MAKVLVLVNPATLQILSTKDYLLSFELFSDHDVSYMPEVPPAWMARGQTNRRSEKDYSEIMSPYDVVVVSQHLRICYDGWINEHLDAALMKFDGVKAVFLHDEYDNTEKAREWIEKQEVDLVYTVVPEPHVSKVYNPERFPKTEFKSILTGYLPLKFSRRNGSLPIVDRKNLLVYRGRVSPESYGALAKQKEMIGRFFDKYCQEHSINADIQWEEAERVYGLDWYRLMETGVATLGTESGSNVFDELGLIREHIAQGKTLPGPKSLNFREENLGFKMNQISPKLFEAIGCGTGLVLYDGHYSGVLEPETHYFSLKHDHSNADQIVDMLNDPKRVQSVVDRAWDHVSSSKHLHFEHLIEMFDSDIKSRVIAPRHTGKSSEGLAQHLLVGEFSDIAATGTGVFSALHQDAQSFQTALTYTVPTNVKRAVSYQLKGVPWLKRIILRCLNLLSQMRYNTQMLFYKLYYKLFYKLNYLSHKLYYSLNYRGHKLYYMFHWVFYRCVGILSLIKMHGYHWGRKLVRLLPNMFPFLGRLKRRYFPTKT